MSLALASRRAAISPAWVKNPLWRTARAVPSLDLQFADTKSLADAVTGQSLVTFTRASSATYVGSDGLIKTATTNLLTFSEDQSNAAWLKVGATISSNSVAAPTGSITADTLVEDTSTGTHRSVASVTILSSTIYSVSIFAKAAGRTHLRLNVGSGMAGEVIANLSNGTVASSSGATNPVVQTVGDGWYRISFTTAASTSTTGQVIAQLVQGTSTTSYTGDGTSGIYLWGAQLEQSSTVGEYIPTTSTINSAPRFDHNPTTGESLGLLVEEQRTNWIRNNTMVGAVAGTPGTVPTNWTVSTATNLSREVIGTGVESGINYIDLRFTGTVTAARTQYIFFEPINQIAAINGQSWAGSAWLKLAGGSLTNITSVSIQADTRDSALVYVNTPYNSAISLTSTLTRFAASGLATGASVAWVQPFVQFTTAASGSIDITLRIGLPQLEQGAFATSVIPTTTAAATRSADVASITGTAFSSWYRADEGTVFAEWFGGPVAANKYPSVISARQTSANNSQNTIEIFQGPSLTNVRANGLVRVLNVDQVSRDSGDLTFVGAKVKAALGTRTNDFVFTANGVQVGAVDTSGTLPTVDTLNIGFNTAVEQLGGRISRLTYWPARLANSTLQAITQ